MDFMKVFDQTVREIKREVNLRVLKVPEVEQKVLDATSDEPWGPHGSALAEIAKETNKFTECQMVMGVLWSRLSDTGANWRHIYKALAVIEYLLANGSERAVDDIIEHTFQISSLSSFEYVEPNGKDMGINVRKKAETVASLLNDRDKIKAVRDKAAATRDKYFGLSSAGITHKSSATSFGSSNFSQYDRYGGTGGSREGERFKESHKDKFEDGDEIKGNDTGETDGRKLKNKSSRRARINDSSSGTLKPSTKKNSESSSKFSSPQINNSEDDFDDFDPRGSAGAGAVSGSSKQVDIVSDSLLIDLMDEPSSPPKSTASARATVGEPDLFADATFLSAPPPPSTEEVDLFAHQSAPDSSVPSNVNLFDIPKPVAETAVKPLQTKSTDSASFDLFATVPLSTVASAPSHQPETTKSENFDPFATVPLNTFNDSDFGAFTSHAASAQPESSQDPASNGISNLSQTSSPMSKQPPKKDTFQVKSGIWADSLSRGLIDLNITAPTAAKKVSLADVGIVGSLNDPSEEEKGIPGSMYMGRAMGSGAGFGWSAFSSSGGPGGNNSMSNQQQWGNFK